MRIIVLLVTFLSAHTAHSEVFLKWGIGGAKNTVELSSNDQSLQSSGDGAYGFTGIGWQFNPFIAVEATYDVTSDMDIGRSDMKTSGYRLDITGLWNLSQDTDVLFQTGWGEYKLDFKGRNRQLTDKEGTLHLATGFQYKADKNVRVRFLIDYFRGNSFESETDLNMDFDLYSISIGATLAF